MGLMQDVNRAFTAAGWENFTETGSHLSTMEFLATLHVQTVGTETKILFCLFNEFFEMKPKEFSIALRFNKKCILDPSVLASDHDYDHRTWWSAISDEPVSSKNSIISVHNPALRILAKYLAMVVFS